MLNYQRVTAGMVKKCHDFQDVPTPWNPGQPTAVPMDYQAICQKEPADRLPMLTGGSKNIKSHVPWR